MLSRRGPTAPRFLVAALAHAAFTAISFAFVEWRGYLQIGPLQSSSWAIWDRIAVFWLLCVKSLVLLAPGWVAALAISRRRPALAGAMGVGCSTLVVCWLAADLHVHRVFAAHVADFVPFVVDGLAAGAESDHRQWAGGWAGPGAFAAGLLVATTLALAILWKTLQRGAARLLREAGPRATRRATALGVGLVALLVVAVIPAQCLVSDSVPLRRLHASLPVAIPGLDVFSYAPDAWLPGEGPPRGPRLVAALPNPMGRDAGREALHLHNFSPAPVALSDWKVVDRKGNVHVLAGDLAPRENLVVTLPEGGLRLNNDGDELELIDPRGRTVQRAAYRERDVGFATLVRFDPEGESRRRRRRLEARLGSVYAEFQQKLLRPSRADESARLAREDPPNVILIVLESFQRSLVGPGVMRRLDRLGQRGLRLRKHYAGTNISHLGWFALLYARSPLAYDPTLDAGIPPQAVVTLKRSGYECSFLTSGDCAGWRRMGEFVNERHFDRIVVQPGETWRDWPRRDRRTLAEVARLAKARRDGPQFIAAFLMSSHYPYPYPKRFAVHQPAGREGHFANSSSWVPTADWSLVDAEILRNRYKNAALFLEDEIVRLVESLDMERNVVIVTGDHGESTSEDGGLTHGTLPSEIQTRVPFLMIGPGVPRVSVDLPTTHADVLPTLLPILTGRRTAVASCSGRDVLAEPLEESVLLVPYRWTAPYEFVLRRGDEALLFRYHLDRPSLELVGFCGTDGKIDFEAEKQTAVPEEAWESALRRQLGRATR